MSDKKQIQRGGGLGPTPSTTTATTTAALQAVGGLTQTEKDNLSSKIKSSKIELAKIVKVIDSNIKICSKDISLEDLSTNVQILSKAIKDAEIQYSNMITSYTKLQDKSNVDVLTQEKGDKFGLCIYKIS